MKKLLLIIIFFASCSSLVKSGKISYKDNSLKEKTTFHVSEIKTPKNPTLPIHEAVFYDDLSKLKFLLENGDDINSKMEDGNTALTLAAYMGHINIVKFLIEKGADLTLKNNNGNSAVVIALYKKYGYS